MGESQWWRPPATLRQTTTPPVVSAPVRSVSPGEVAIDSISNTVGIVPYSFGFASLGASQSNLRASRTVAGLARQIAVPVPFRGSVVGIGFSATGNKTGGTATFTAFRNGTALEAAVSWANATNKGLAAFPRGRHGVSVGDDLDIRATTDASFAPTTLDVEVILYVVEDTSTAA